MFCKKISGKKAFSGVAFAVFMTAIHSLNAATGPSSSHDPYLIPLAPGVSFTALLTVGDSVNNKKDGTPYKLVGLPDGLGAFDEGDTFVVLVNHELRNTLGIAREHNSSDPNGKGSFVSKWTIRKSDLTVLHGEDLIKTVKIWDTTTSSFINSTSTSFSRFCSASLACKEVFFNKRSGNGFKGFIFLTGEETTGGRAFAHIVTGGEAGISYELPSLGKYSFENAVPCPLKNNDKTIVIGLDDGEDIGKVFVYAGNKQKNGNPVEQAGLHGGILYGIKVDNTPNEDRDTGLASNSFTLFSYGDVRNLSGSDLQATGDANGVTNFLRPEDGAWDTKNPNRFYFVTTDRYDQTKDGVGTQTGHSRLWRLIFKDIKQPEAGGTIEMLLDGTGSCQMLDNITVDDEGNVLMLEDVGNVSHNGKIWIYKPDTFWLTELGKHDVNRFGDLVISATPPFSQDEESSGIIEVTDLFKNVAEYDTKHVRYFLLDTQAHKTTEPYNTPELVEGGQLLLMSMPSD
ncbi:MAG: hypothetical protein QG591_567 [Planctomycetota bacterium]|nr:hypothetical protein [Planctomycetota bacterium]